MESIEDKGGSLMGPLYVLRVKSWLAPWRPWKYVMANGVTLTKDIHQAYRFEAHSIIRLQDTFITKRTEPVEVQREGFKVVTITRPVLNKRGLREPVEHYILEAVDNDRLTTKLTYRPIPAKQNLQEPSSYLISKDWEVIYYPLTDSLLVVRHKDDKMEDAVNIVPDTLNGGIAWRNKKEKQRVYTSHNTKGSQYNAR